jgi:hypothetical protein
MEAPVREGQLLDLETHGEICRRLVPTKLGR